MLITVCTTRYANAVADSASCKSAGEQSRGEWYKKIQNEDPLAQSMGLSMRKTKREIYLICSDLYTPQEGVFISLQLECLKYHFNAKRAVLRLQVLVWRPAKCKMYN